MQLSTAAQRPDSNAHLSGTSRYLRRTIPVAIAVGLVAIAGLTLSGTLTASNGDRQGECSLATLRGRYLFANSGIALPPAFGRDTADVGG